MKKRSYPAYYFILIMYLEMLLRFGIGLSSSWGLFLITSFSIVYALVVHLIERWIPERFHRTFRIGLTFLACFIFAAQFVYFRIFQTFFTLYSVSKSAQVVEFIPDVIYVIRTNIAYIGLFMLPFVYIIVVKPTAKLKTISVRLIALAIALVMIMNYTVLDVMHDVTNNPKDVYFHNRELVNGIRQLGLLTTMRLDLQRMAGITMSTPRPPMADRQPTDPQNDNVLDLTFPQDEELADLTAYFSNRAGSNKNDHTGRLEGYNVITVIAESFSHLAIDPELTPTLYQLSQEGVRFENFYNPLWGVSTIDGEYANLTGLLPVAGVWALYETAENAMPFVPGQMFQAIDYATYSFHNHNYHYYRRDVIHPNLGYTFLAKGNGLEISDAWPESDVELFENSLDYYIDQPPFHVNYLTVSGHMMYRFNGHDMADKNHHLVKDLDMSEEAKAYLAGQIELDRGLKILMDALEDRDLLDNTLIVVAADHHPYALPHTAMEELAGRQLDKRKDIYQSALLMYAKGINGQVITKPCSNIDIVPTIYNLLGMEFDSRLFMGSDIFSDAPALVMFQDRSFLVEEGFYDAVKHRFYPNVGTYDQATIKDYRDSVDRRFYYSEQLIIHDYFRRLIEE